MMRNREFWLVFASGGLLGLLGVLLSVWGNPENSGICVSCFMENAAGALGLHDNQRMQYLRPELMGFVLGAVASAFAFRDFQPRGGSSPLSRLVLGIFMIFGCTVFVGCPIKLFLRLAAGDAGAFAGAAGLLAGVWGGLKGLADGAEFERSAPVKGFSSYLNPLLFLLLLLFYFIRPGFILFSSQGGASQHAPWMLSLGAGVVLGALAQRSRFCITGSIRNVMLMGLRIPAFWGLLAFVTAAALASIISGRFSPGLYGQPGAHSEFLWSFLGMGLVGWISVLIAGCPFRQLIKAGEGDTDAALVVAGMFIGGALAQSWGIAATAAGVSLYGKISVLAGLFCCAAASLAAKRQK